MGKYVSAMVAAGVRITYSRHPHQNHFWFAMVLVTSVVATVYQLYWDFVKDWGFFDPKSKNPWLRDDLVLKNKKVYYASIVSLSSFQTGIDHCFDSEIWSDTECEKAKKKKDFVGLERCA